MYDLRTIPTVSKPEQKEVQLEVGLPQGGFPRTLFFTRFKVERSAEFVVVQFGLVASGLRDWYACLLPTGTLKQNEHSLLDYLNRIGRAQQKPDTSWDGLTGELRADVADVITMAHRDEIAEICLYVFSISAATRFSKPGPTRGSLIAQPLALLRSSSELQKQLIQALYAE